MRSVLMFLLLWPAGRGVVACVQVNEEYARAAQLQRRALQLESEALILHRMGLYEAAQDRILASDSLYAYQFEAAQKCLSPEQRERLRAERDALRAQQP